MRDTADSPSKILLNWYDLHARIMPWRVPPDQRKMGVLPDPYHVWLSEVMLQQTTVAAVKAYFLEFTRRWPTVEDLAAAADADVMAAWAGLGYYARARNLLKCARVIANEMEGHFPNTPAELLKLPGIGPYTAASLSAIAFDAPSVVLDGNVERVMARIHAVIAPLPGIKETLRELAADWTPHARAGDYAQAVMDLGATVCTPRSPSCGLCPWADFCQATTLGIAADLPNKTPKAAKPKRYGTIFIAIREDGAVLLERRPETGLLGGMLGWIGSDWTETMPQASPPLNAEWKGINEQVRHTFTHFHLFLNVAVAHVAVTATPSHGMFVENFDPNDLPTVMRKAWSLVQKR